MSRRKLFKNRFKDWKISEKTLKYIVERTDGWTGAEAQELVNTVNLDFINSKRKSKVISQSVIKSALTMMNSFGIGNTSGKSFGFNSENEE